MHAIISADRALFGYINEHLHSGFFDWLMPWVRNSYTWIPLYIFLFIFVLLNFPKDRIPWLFFAIVAVSLSDLISSDIIKDHVFRLRPCNDPAFIPHINFLLSYRPQSSSFTSSHAMNHFTMAAFFFFTLKKYVGRAASLFFAWAALISCAQVYVSVHFPLDVLSGAILGFVFGYLFAGFYNRTFSLT